MRTPRLSTAKIVYLILVAVSAVAGSWSGYTMAAEMDDAATVAALDTRYQAAVKVNDAATMDAILHDDMILVVGSGTVVTKAELLESARRRSAVYTQQDEEPGTQKVRLFGPDTAVVTARLWLVYETGGKHFDRKLWFSDTYVRTPKGWKYAFGQASLSLPAQ